MNYDHSQDLKIFESEFKPINISEESLNLTRQAMREVVLTGLASDLRNYPVSVAAKTGTAQNVGDDHTTFMGYAPFENPKVAFAVIVANGKYGSVSKSVARAMLDACREINYFWFLYNFLSVKFEKVIYKFFHNLLKKITIYDIIRIDLKVFSDDF